MDGRSRKDGCASTHAGVTHLRRLYDIRGSISASSDRTHRDGPRRIRQRVVPLDGELDIAIKY